MELIALHPDLIVCEKGSEQSETNDKMKHVATGTRSNTAKQNTSLPGLV